MAGKDTHTVRIGEKPLLATIKERCRMCYTCIRECPAHAIRVSEGQASVVAQRCIGCGNCIRVCSQQAKQVYSSVPEVEHLLATYPTVVAMLAPSYPAEFDDLEPDQLVGALKWLGFSSVHEVSFGADLVAREYARLLATTDQSYIGSTCPALVSYVEKYQPDSIPNLIPIVSPMIAMARVLREHLGPDIRVVFIGPCIAKKGEAAVGADVRDEVDAVLTFQELRHMLTARAFDATTITPEPMAAPRGRLGGLFAISRGLLQAAGLHEDLLSGDLVVADGRVNFWSALRSFRKTPGDVRLLEVLCCRGCIGGPGFSHDLPPLEKRHRVKRVLKRELERTDPAQHEADLARFSHISLERSYAAYDQRLNKPSEMELAAILARMGKTRPEDELNCGACGYDTCRRHATAIHRGLAEVEMCLPYTIETLRSTVGQLEESHQDLSEVREALSQSEKLASMGQVAAGIAHEVNNPLGVVLLYANLLVERCAEIEDINDDLQVVVEHADRCKKIVAGLLNFARQNRVFRQNTDVRELFADAIKAVPAVERVNVTIETTPEHPAAELDPDQMLQVITNLISNACAAMPDGGDLTLRARESNGDLVLEIADTGTGIPRENMKKIFEPFFTTKQVGRGTGLGLAVTHGIVKMHSGQIQAISNADAEAGPTGTTFRITLPRHDY